MKSELATQPGDVGMTFKQDLLFEDWEEIGRKFGEATKRFSWALGDWLVYGGTKFKQQISTEAYIDAEKVTGVDRQSLLAFATVCRRIPMEDRLPHLTFQHHQAISSIANDEKRGAWLRFLSNQEIVPSKKILKLSIDCFPDEPALITQDQYDGRRRKFGSNNYIPHLTRLLSVLRKTIPAMDEDERAALRADTEGLLSLINRV